MSSPPDRRRQVATLLIKLLVGAAILVFIAGQLTIEDEVVLQDGTVLSGTLLNLTGTVGLADDPGQRRFDLAERPPRIAQDEHLRWRIEPGREEPIEAGEPILEGSLTIELIDDGGQRTVRLSEVAWSDRGEGEGFRERNLRVREGLRTIYGRIDPATYVLALLAVLGMYLCGIKRWQILLRAQGLDTSFAEAFRLTFIGFFFNNVVPGLTGGDVVKAVLIARRHPGRGPDAVSTVIVDRVIGLLMLALVAGVAVLFALEQYGEIGLYIGFILAGASLGIPLFLSRRVRRKLGLDWLLERMPGSAILKRLDEAFRLYRQRPREMAWALALSIAAHVCNIASVALIGLDLGVGPENGLEEPAALTYAVIVPITMIVAAVPVLPGGWGVGEAAFGYFFRTVGIQNLSLSVGLSVLHRATLLAFSLIGGIFLLRARKETREALAEGGDPDQRDPAPAA